MYQETVQHFVGLSNKKAAFMRNHPIAFWVQCMMAGSYVGLGILLIFTIGSTIDPAIQKLVMGVSFGVALTLIVFAGAELFTGHTMYSTFAYIARKQSLSTTARVWITVWLGNLAGCLALAYLYKLGAGPLMKSGGSEFIQAVASYKMNSSALELVARGALCNWLVCLALWMAARTASDAAKTVVIFWALFAFITSGFEHSIANMTVLSVALLGPTVEGVTYAGFGHNMLWVTIGNIIGGSLFMGVGYSLGRDPSQA